MNDDLREKEDEYECFVFCLKHQEIGKRELKNGGKARIQQGSIESGKLLQKFVGEKMPKRGSKTRCKNRVTEEDEEMNECDLQQEEDIDDDDEEVEVNEEADGTRTNRRKKKSTRKGGLKRIGAGSGLKVVNKVS